MSKTQGKNDLEGFIDYLKNPPVEPDLKIKDVIWSNRRVSVIFSDGRECALIIDKSGAVELYSDSMRSDETHARKLVDDNTGGARVMVINYFGTPSDGDFT